MITFYLICFILGIALSILTVAGGFTHLHIGRVPLGHVTAHTPGHGPAIGHAAHGHRTSHGLSAVNGFTITAFLCWFGLAGYLLYRYTSLIAITTLLLATLSGIVGASLLWAVLFKLLLPRERVLTAEETEMPGVIARVSDAIRDNNSIGEIIFSQTGARRATAARSEDGAPIPRGTEVIVMRYDHGIAYVRNLSEAADTWDDSHPNTQLTRDP
jgi:hypothetical protein